MSKSISMMIALLLLVAGTVGAQSFTAMQGDNPQEISTSLTGTVTITVPNGDQVYVRFKVNGVWETEVHTHTGNSENNPPYQFADDDVIDAVAIEYCGGGSGSPPSVAGTIS
ncbi:MAG: hypothetical protein H6807_07265 [Planctomycetes bacterium]|nr:hypothetical protein [Planctomycetota bacterium]